MSAGSRSVRLLLLLSCAAACGDDPARPGGGGEIGTLPLAGSPNGPVITDVGLEVQPGVGIVAFATALDPQGGQNLRDVPQRIGVFPDARCQGTPVIIEDDLTDAGVEETFGTLVPAGSPLFDRIAAAASWPVQLRFRDLDGNETAGIVQARVQ